MGKRSARKAKHRPGTASTSVSAVAPPSLPRFASEQMLRDIHKILESHELETVDDANALLLTLTGAGLESALAKAAPLSPKEEAQDLAYDAMDAPDHARAIALARAALAKDPDCVDAIMALTAANENSIEGALAGLEKAVAAGERSLGPRFFQENKGHFWGILETRPYMRARYELAELLLEENRVPEAIRHFEALLELNPNDNQGVRDVLLGCYLANNKLDGAGHLLAQYEEDGSAVFEWGRVLERILSGDFGGATRAFKRAWKGNRFVELFMTGRKKFPHRMPDSYSFGSEEEALVCLEALGAAWASHPEAMLWVVGAIEGIFDMDSSLVGQAKLNF